MNHKFLRLVSLLTVIFISAITTFAQFPTGYSWDFPRGVQSELLQTKLISNQQKTIAFINGKWFDGKEFKPQTFYSFFGFLTSKKPLMPFTIDQTIDLKGGFVIPPFGEAHNHNVAQSSRVDAIIQKYLESGIFYVKNPNSLPRATMPLIGKINIPTSIDAVFSGGGLTASGGHPIGVANAQIARGDWNKNDGEGAFYYTIDSHADFDKKWNSIIAGHPDFIKTYLLYSEEYQKRKSESDYLDWRGLDPSLLPEIVQHAHRAGLRVSTHVESATDFHSALVAGVDEINHLPGFRPEKNNPGNYQNLSRYEISEADARLAARKKVVVVTTIGDVLDVVSKIDESSPQAALAKDVKNLFSRNLRLLAKEGVRIAIGSDSYSKTSLSEALNLNNLKVFDNLTLLKMWCETTPNTIFPKRKIGQLKTGYEASFLLLERNPLEDFEIVKNIKLWVKQGQILDLEKSKEVKQ